MARILLALDACAAAFGAAPLLDALAAAGSAAAVAWFGSEADRAIARRLGMPEPAFAADDDVAAFAERVLDERGWEVVATTGDGAFAVALAVAAAMRGLTVVRLDAGLRGGDPTGRRDRRRRLADAAATTCLVASGHQRDTLCREGVPAAAIHVVGSLLPAALGRAGTPAAAAPRAPFVLLAFEHGGDDAVRPRLADAEAALGCGVATTQDHSGPEQAALARTAHAIVTDSAGWQEFAAVVGVPAIFVGDTSPRPETVLAGRCRQVGDPTDLAAALAWAVAEPRPRPSLYADAVAASVAALQVAASAPAATTATGAATASTLPSDGDATGRTFDDAERLLVGRALLAGTLNSTRGTFVTRFEREFAAWLGAKHAIACASGSAAVHCAIAALRLAAGDEVITTPITDMGALTPIFYEGAVPVFADVDPVTLNVTAATIAAQITKHTRAIVVTHLFGNPCDLDAIRALATRHGLPIVEDSAQAFGATWHGHKVGTFGRLGAFSLQQGKHITTGEGGIVCTDDDDLARRVFLFVNKAWGYGDANPDHYFPALNYRMTELQGAVACAQLPKLDGVVAARRAVAAALRERLVGLRGLGCPADPPHGAHSYWKFALRVDAAAVPGGAVALGKRLRDRGIACVPRYIQKPAFECQLFRDWRQSPVMALPLGQNPRGLTTGPLFDRSAFPGALAGLEQVVVLPINERYRPEHVQTVASAIHTAHRELCGSAANGREPARG